MAPHIVWLIDRAGKGWKYAIHGIEGRGPDIHQFPREAQGAILARMWLRAQFPGVEIITESMRHPGCPECASRTP